MGNKIVTSPKAIFAIQRFIPKRFYCLIMPFAAFLLFFCCFVGTVILLFPKDDLRAPLVALIQQQTGLDISIGDLSFSPPLKLELKEITWQPALENWPSIEMASFSLSPFWTSLLGSNPAGRFHASIAEGTVSGRFAKDGSGNVLLASLQLGSMVSSQFPFAPRGTLGGTIRVGEGAGTNIGSVAFDLVVEDLMVGGLIGLGLPANELSLGRLQLRGKIMGNTVTIEDLQNEAGDLFLAAHGTVLINKRLERSRLNLQVVMRPGAKLGPEVQQLLLFAGLKVGNDGSYNFRIVGTLAQPSLR